MCSCLCCSVAGVYVCVCVAHTICLRNEFGVHTACWGYADMHARKISVLCMRSSLSSIYLSVCLSVHTHTHTHTHTHSMLEVRRHACKEDFQDSKPMRPSSGGVRALSSHAVRPLSWGGYLSQVLY